MSARRAAVTPSSRSLSICLAMALCLATPAPAGAADDTPEEVGLAIAEAARARENGFGDFTAQQVMLLRNRQGRESRRELRVQVLEVPGDGNRTRFVFDEPRDVAGTAFLVHAHRADDDDQWIYLPALRRVKRISSGNRSGSFMGSEFSYEDMTPPEVEKFTYRYLRDEPCGESVCTVTERVPVDRRSGYRRQIVWRDTDELRVWRIEYYDRRDLRLKTLTVSDYSLHLDRYWRPGDMTMANHLTGKATVLTWTNYRFRTGLDAGAFTRTGLRRAR